VRGRGAAADVYDDNLAAASRGLGDIGVVGRGANGAIYERHLAGGAWTSWASLGGAAMSGPAAAAYGDSIHVFVTGTDGAVHENVLRGGAWSGWAGLGGVATSAPAAIARVSRTWSTYAGSTGRCTRSTGRAAPAAATGTIRARLLHAQGLAQAAPQHRLAPLHDVRLGAARRDGGSCMLE
jgi:hypothetical protein